MRTQSSALDASLNRFAALRAEAARRDRERRACEASRSSLVRLYGERPTEAEAAGMLADLDARLAKLRGW